jgi:ABC-type transporter Mla maintaining outer membrane lipid asymmetry ATPase subunit MlaF
MAGFIEIKDLTCRTREGGVIFERASLSLGRGERVVVTGPVASGKGVLVRLLAGLTRPDEGSSIRVDGSEITGLAGEGLNVLRSRMGFVFEDCVLISNLKVIENVALPLQYHAGLGYGDSIERAGRLLEMAGFRGDPWDAPGPLPVYARKGVAAARALSLEPAAIVCENLSYGLTRAEFERLAGFLIEYQERYEGKDGRLLLFTAHDEAESSVLRPGRIVGIEERRFVER